MRGINPRSTLRGFSFSSPPAKAFSTTTALLPWLVFSGTYQTDAPHGGADWIEHT
ncbi:TPA: hypothetical protein ACGTQP_004781 [Salmonella enterica]